MIKTVKNKPQIIVEIERDLIRAVEERLKRKIYPIAILLMKKLDFYNSVVEDVLRVSNGKIGDDNVKALHKHVRILENALDMYAGKTARESKKKLKKKNKMSRKIKPVDAYYVDEDTLEANDPLSELDMRLACLSKIVVEEIKFYPEISRYLQDNTQIDQCDVIEWLKGNSESHFIDSSGLESFENPKPQDHLVYCKNWFKIPDDEDHPLRKLKHIVGLLTEEYIWWNETQTIDFILAGVAPEIPKGIVTIRGPNLEFSKNLHEESKLGDLELPYYFSPWGEAAKMIIMKLNPRLSPMEITKAYRKARRSIFSSQIYPMDEKSMQLALCCLEYDGITSWKMIMEAWNNKWRNKKPDWKHTKVSNFHKDARRAWKQITGVPFPSKTIIQEMRKRR